jgi:hypothetical protein
MTPNLLPQYFSFGIGKSTDALPVESGGVGGVDFIPD